MSAQPVAAASAAAHKLKEERESLAASCESVRDALRAHIARINQQVDDLVVQRNRYAELIENEAYVQVVAETMPALMESMRDRPERSLRPMPALADDLEEAFHSTGRKCFRPKELARAIGAPPSEAIVEAIVRALRSCPDRFRALDQGWFELADGGVLDDEGQPQ